MKDLKTIEEKVKAVLTENMAARNDDMKLYLYVCDYTLSDKDIHVGNMPFETVMEQYRSLGIPCFESVRRTRQKLQAKYPELAGNRQIQKLRAAQEKVYRKYAKE